MKYEFDLIAIGGGSAGLLAAEVTPRLGLKTALVERSRLGGDCLWTGCVPSKTLLASAKAAHTMRHADKYGLPSANVELDTATVWKRLSEVQEAIATTDDNPDRYRELGVEVVIGEGTLVDEHTVRVGERALTARRILLCTGSRPATPPIEGLDEAGFLTSENIFQLERAPRSLLVVGAGPIGVEIAQAMNRLGVKTTVLEVAPRMLARDEPALAEALLGVLLGEGVDVRLNVRLDRASRSEGGKVFHGSIDGEAHTWSAEEIFVAAGRKANIESLGLDRVGVETGPRGIIVDKKLRTSVKSIYAVGDCIGRFLFTHSAGAETATAIRNMFYVGSQSAPELIPWATFTDPELAHVGMTSAEARQKYGETSIRVYEWDLQQNDRARTDAAEAGRVVVVTESNSKILGAHILAPAASEMIGQFTLAIDQGMRLTPAFRNLVQVYPTFSTSIPRLAEEALYEETGKPLFRAARRLNELFGL
ncbi:MAG: FAD-dependent oxidoreductase [Chloroflexi bacterium]|nr:FAD-dependent oxidoreductase [Chloroflexota bacterium]